MIRILTLALFLWFPVLAHGAACEATGNENFLTFFFQFSNSKDFAVSRTVYPLKVLAQEYGIDELGNNVSSSTRLQRSKQQDAELPSLSFTLQEGSLIAKVHEQSANSSIVQVFGSNSEWGQTYHFSRKGKCWFLREFREHTISDQHWVERQEAAPRSEFVPHFYIKPDDQPLRAMLKVLNHLAFVIESLSVRDTEDALAELLSLCENLEASVDYDIANREQVAAQLRETLSVINRGGNMEGSVMLGNISRMLWETIR